MGVTFVPPDVRRAVATDPSVGGGNALSVAMRIGPDTSAPFLYADDPVRDATGKSRSRLSLAELTSLVDAWSAWYLERGVSPRDRVGIYLREGAINLIHYLALSRLGAIAVLINAEMPAGDVLTYLRRTDVTGLQTDDIRARRLAEAGGPPADGYWTSSVDDTVPRAAVPGRQPFRHVPGDPVLICHTSGTTGVPKPVIWTQGQMMVGVRAHLVRFLEHPDSLILSALPQSHGSAIGYAVLALLSGVPLVLMGDRSGKAVAAAADRYRATTVVGFAVTFADLALHELGTAALDTVERWVSVGDASHHAHVSRLVRYGRHWNRGVAVTGSMFVDGFGSSELGWGGVLGMITVAGMAAPHRCLGVPQPFAEVAVLQEDGEPAPPLEVGMLGVRGDTVTPGYWNDADRTYRSMLNGYWLSGDLVYRDEQNRFYHVDRTVDAIPTANGPVYSVLTEEILLAHFPEIEDCVVLRDGGDGDSQAVALVHLLAGHGPEGLLERANEILGRRSLPPLGGLEPAHRGAIPVGVTGKVLKRRLRRNREDGVR